MHQYQLLGNKIKMKMFNTDNINDNKYIPQNLPGMQEIKEKENRIQWLQYVNTFILTSILGFAMMIFITVNNVKSSQADIKSELMRLKTVQDINVSNVSSLDHRVTNLEMNKFEELRKYMEDNFVRKPQK
jgi:hypothetical protein